MNMSEVVTRLKLQMGLAAMATPFNDINATLVEIIQNITVPVFSLYAPYREKINLHTNDLERVERGAFYERYNLPDFKTRKLLYVFDVSYDTEYLTGLGYYGGGMPFMQGGLINQTMLANSGAQVMNYMIPKLTFHFSHPRQITLYNIYSSSRVVIDMGFEHDKSLASIKESTRESFMRLAELDCKWLLYPTMKQYTDIQTAIGNINLKIDDWSNAESDRRDLINQWDDTYHMDLGPILYYI